MLMFWRSTGNSELSDQFEIACKRSLPYSTCVLFILTIKLVSTDGANSSCNDNSVMVALIATLAAVLIVVTVVCVIIFVLLRKLKSSVQ